MKLDIIPDIHGQGAKLDALLAALGYTIQGGKWTADRQDRRIVFLGDLIDRGPNQRDVINRVRQLEDDGLADRVLGNHELNALHWEMERDGEPVRRHTPSNHAHHRAFLEAFEDRRERREVLDWMTFAPLCRHYGWLVAVHAFWTPQLEQAASAALGGGRGFEAWARNPAFLDAAIPTGVGGMAIDLMTKGPETRLPQGFSIETEHGIVRQSVRRSWWVPTPSTWQEGCSSLPDGAVLPAGSPPGLFHLGTVPEEKSVVFGHYWRRDIQAQGRIPTFEGRLACLDQSAGAGGLEPLVALTVDLDQPGLPVDGQHLDPRHLTIVR